MSVEGLYIIYFDEVGGVKLPPDLKLCGTVVLESGRVFGGDLQFYYLGTYEVSGDMLTAKARCIHHNGPGTTAWNTIEKQFDLTVTSRRLGRNFIGTMQRGQMQLPAALIWKADLP